MSAEVFRQTVALLCHPECGVSLDAGDWERLVRVLRDANMLGTLYHLAADRGVMEHYPAYARRHLASMATYAARQARQVLYECREVSDILGAEGIKPIFLKGAGYTLGGSRSGRGRIYSDIDVLVSRDEIDTAHAALKRQAWYTKPMREYDERYYREWAHEIPPLRHLTRRTVLDLHHNIVPPISGRAPNMAPLLASRETTESGLLVLSAPAATLHSIVHLLMNEDFTNAFRDLTDINLLVEDCGTEAFWRSLHELAQQCGFSRELYFAVLLLADVFDRHAPEWLLSQLGEQYAAGIRARLLRRLLRSAVRPHHPLIRHFPETLCIHALYLRGHWIRMPVLTLARHLSVKGFFSIRDKLLGKHQFESKVPFPKP